MELKLQKRRVMEIAQGVLYVRPAFKILGLVARSGIGITTQKSLKLASWVPF